MTIVAAGYLGHVLKNRLCEGDINIPFLSQFSIPRSNLSPAILKLRLQRLRSDHRVKKLHIISFPYVFENIMARNDE